MNDVTLRPLSTRVETSLSVTKRPLLDPDRSRVLGKVKCARAVSFFRGCVEPKGSPHLEVLETSVVGGGVTVGEGLVGRVTLITDFLPLDEGPSLCPTDVKWAETSKR